MKVFDENIPQNVKSGTSLAVNGRRVVTAKRSALGEITNKTSTAIGQPVVKKTAPTATLNAATSSVSAVPSQTNVATSQLPSAVPQVNVAAAQQPKQLIDPSNVRRVPLVSAANNAKKQAAVPSMAAPTLMKMETSVPFAVKQVSVKPTAADAFTIYQEFEEDEIEDDDLSQSETSQDESSLIEEDDEVELENIEPMDIEQVQILGRSQVKDAMSHIPSFPSASLVYSGLPKPQFDMMFDQDDILDIDAGDMDDPQFCTEYVSLIFHYLREKEMRDRVNPNYMDRQVDITRKHRTILVDWLSEVCTRFKLLTETMFICVNIVDRFLQYKSVSKQKLQLVGVTALLIACKFEEIYTPEVEDFIYITDQAYTRDDLLKMERLILMTLDFNLSTPTPLHFLRRFSRAAQSNSKIHTLSKYLAELSLLEAKLLQFLPSMVAAASVYIARKMTHQSPVWTSTLQYYSGYSAADILPCVQELNAVLKKQPSSSYKAIAVKYSSQQLLSVALIPPLDC